MENIDFSSIVKELGFWKGLTFSGFVILTIQFRGIVKELRIWSNTKRDIDNKHEARMKKLQNQSSGGKKKQR